MQQVFDLWVCELKTLALQGLYIGEVVKKQFIALLFFILGSVVLLQYFTM